MYLLHPPAIVVAFLIVAVSIPQPLFSQTAPKPSKPKLPAPRQRQPERPQRADALASVIKELLKAHPPAPKSPDEKAPDGNAPEGEEKPPADDAPIKELVAYWPSHRNRLSDRVRQRLLEACEDRPELFDYLMDCLPENADTHDRLYKLLNEESESKENWKLSARDWLRRNSAYFRDELIKGALAVDDDSHEDLYALARLDWNKARPILETLASSGKAQVKTVALALFYEHAAQEGDSARTESYRSILKAIVENRQAIWPTRMESLKSLMGSEWSGQEEWFISLFVDPTLSGFREGEISGAAKSKDESSVKADVAKGEVVEVVGAGGAVMDTPRILDDVLLRNPDRWIPVISNLVGHNHRTVHNTAVKCMVGFLTSESGDEKKKKEIAQRLMPWLTEPNWAAKEVRRQFISSLFYLNMPELAPGLTWVLDNDENPDNRAAAADALAQYCGPRSIPALRRALEKEWGLEKKECENNCRTIIFALVKCGGCSDDEMATAVEAYAREATLEEGDQKSMVASAVLSLKPPLPNVSIGGIFKVSLERMFNESKPIQVTEGLAVRLIERAKALRATEPAVARKILRVVEDFPLRVAEVNLVERIGEGWADLDSIKLALKTRDALMKSAGEELYGLIKEGGYAAGVAAAILADEREWKAMLENGDAKAQLALFACARYLRDKLPVDPIAGLLNSPNIGLAKAADSYIEIEDSAEARKLVLARHPGEAYIVGDLTAVSSYGGCIEAARKGEDELRKEVRGRNGSDAIYAVTRRYSQGPLSGVIIRVRGGKAEMTVYETQGRRNVRWLTDSEFEELKNFTSRQEVEELGPESYSVDSDVIGQANYEYLRLTRESGRRIALTYLRRASKDPTPHEELSGLFYRLSKSGEFITRYDIVDKIPGVDVVFADKNRSALKVCAEGGEMRALIEEKGAGYKQGGAKAAPEWREFSSGNPGEVRDEPSACRKLNLPSSALKNARGISQNPFSRPAQSDGTLFYVTSGEDEGIWRAKPGIEPAKIVSGDYSYPVITPDGKWLMATKYVSEDQRLIRRNLQSGEEFVISLPQDAYDTYLFMLVYAAAHGKFLEIAHWNGGPGNKGYLLDPETGTVQSVKGEFRPLFDALSRAPQAAGAPNLFWATIYDREERATKFGRYDSKNFAFTPLLEFPELRLSADDIWVDAAGGKIWFVYEGQLLRLPMPAQTK